MTSHPAWVCGLKLLPAGISVCKIHRVTPCVGVWIETYYNVLSLYTVLSHPAWVCGLKPVFTSTIDTVPRHTLRGCVD